jgi:DNA-binding NarL/FixJ family response regulator
MRPLSLVLLQEDSTVAQFLSGQLGQHFHAIQVVRSLPELRDAIPRYRPDVVVMDIESAPLGEVKQLHREFANVSIVCTHRIADEEMWTAAMDAGAADICSATDSRSIVAAAIRNRTIARWAAA